MKSIKEKLYQACLNYAEERISELESTIQQIQLAANEETKSSAGDKYETGRSMAQLEIEKLQSQLTASHKVRQELNRIVATENSQQIKTGSLVFTSGGNFYIAIHAGQLVIDNQTIYAVSTASPIAQKLIGMKAGDAFTLNGREFTIREIQ